MQQITPLVPSHPSANVSTQEIQKYLDENEKLILAILDDQNLGKLAECARYQAQLQKNLIYLAAVADVQQKAPMVPPQIAPHPGIQQGTYHIQQAAEMAHQPGIIPPEMPLQFTSPHQIPHPQQFHQPQAAMAGQMGIRSIGIGVSSSMHPMHHKATLGSGGLCTTSVHNDVLVRNKQDVPDAQ